MEKHQGILFALINLQTGDGIVAGLQILEVMLETQNSLSELVSGMDIYPQHMINVPVGNADAKSLANQKQVRDAVCDAENLLGKTGRVVLRPSGTEPVFRIYDRRRRPRAGLLPYREIVQTNRKTCCGVKGL